MSVIFTVRDLRGRTTLFNEYELRCWDLDEEGSIDDEDGHPMQPATYAALLILIKGVNGDRLLAVNDDPVVDVLICHRRKRIYFITDSAFGVLLED